jgi:hypothetical protein
MPVSTQMELHPFEVLEPIETGSTTAADTAESADHRAPRPTPPAFSELVIDLR